MLSQCADGINADDPPQKGVMISHRNVISNVLQIKTFESPSRDTRPPEDKTEIALGLLPLSHIYGLVVIASASSYRGDGVIVLPKFELQSFLNAIQTQKIHTLYLVSYLPVITLVHLTKFCLGSADHYPNGKKQSGMLKIRSQ
jgi:acyl-CoA synthetase (AMP-forming)/AMP-acid ligase II